MPVNSPIISNARLKCGMNLLKTKFPYWGGWDATLSLQKRSLRKSCFCGLRYMMVCMTCRAGCAWSMSGLYR
jgi:hypothetical protein